MPSMPPASVPGQTALSWFPLTGRSASDREAIKGLYANVPKYSGNVAPSRSATIHPSLNYTCGARAFPQGGACHGFSPFKSAIAGSNYSLFSASWWGTLPRGPDLWIGSAAIRPDAWCLDALQPDCFLIRLRSALQSTSTKTGALAANTGAPTAIAGALIGTSAEASGSPGCAPMCLPVRLPKLMRPPVCFLISDVLFDEPSPGKLCGLPGVGHQMNSHFHLTKENQNNPHDDDDEDDATKDHVSQSGHSFVHSQPRLRWKAEEASDQKSL
ncbi:MAG: hypothetical protein BJ554DRAFT_2622 [Olpidium bornovanus]|uniref:Uncharacterized protein n=1 Tax=Olpidium bornovanus TaxID=278681 RepID=A0A8H7ZQ78_9FUNG|nr:MAG: hypothetical protein BJ554DRAFT_2622 [Olpidium bornovanus]